MNRSGLGECMGFSSQYIITDQFLGSKLKRVKNPLKVSRNYLHVIPKKTGHSGLVWFRKYGPAESVAFSSQYSVTDPFLGLKIRDERSPKGVQ